MSTHAIFRPPAAVNEPIHDYAPGSPERARLQLRARADAQRARRDPARDRRQGRHDRRPEAGRDAARQGARPRRRPPGRPPSTCSRRSTPPRRRGQDWSRWPWEERAAVFLRAAELLAGPWRDTLNAATMLGQSKTAHQAEIDAACESIDFFRFNVEFMTRIYAEQPISSHGRLEPHRVPAARGLRLRGLAVQLHRDRREPDELARADGQHRRLEAGRHRDALGLLPDAPLPGGRACPTA